MATMRRERPTVGILLGWSILAGKLSDRYLASVLRSIQATARLKECHLLLACGLGRVMDPDGIHPAWPEPSPETDFVPVGPWNTDGLIVFAPLRSEARSLYLKGLRDQGCPVLFIATGEGDPMISADNASGIRQAVAHLLDHGHHRIAFVAGDPGDKGDSESRLGAYRQAVSEFGLSTDARLVAAGWHSFSGGYDAARTIIESAVKFTALLASDDSSAIGAMQAIRDAGLKIPADVAVIGFDDQPDTVAQVPPLASVHAPLAEMGEYALTLMLDHLAGRRALESVQIPTRLTPRQSCGCTPPVVSTAGESAAGWRASAAKPGARAPGARRAKRDMVNTMAATLHSGERSPSDGVAQRLCSELLQAFEKSMKDASPAQFQAALMALLQQLESTDNEINPWQAVLSVLRREMLRLPAEWGRAATRRLAENMLHQARAAISESAQRQDYRHEYQREIAAHALSDLTAQLSATLDERQAVKVLEAHLAELGIQHVRVALFESEAADPFAWSILLHAHIDAANQRFRSREFPPPDLYPPDEQLNLAVVPLVSQDESLGYVAFDAGNLEHCAMIARQLAATFKATRLHAQVLELSLTDALTGIYNRRYFDLFLNNEVDRSRRFGRGLAIILLDIDQLKEYNDTYGHPAGDKALKFVALRLDQERRRADVVARIGGDEFALILPETEVEGARKVARRIHTSMIASLELMRPLTLSMGISILAGASPEAAVLIQQADMALYEAKRSGRDRICVFEGTGKSLS